MTGAPDNLDYQRGGYIAPRTQFELPELPADNQAAADPAPEPVVAPEPDQLPHPLRARDVPALMSKIID